LICTSTNGRLSWVRSVETPSRRCLVELRREVLEQVPN